MYNCLKNISLCELSVKCLEKTLSLFIYVRLVGDLR